MQGLYWAQGSKERNRVGLSSTRTQNHVLSTLKEGRNSCEPQELREGVDSSEVSSILQGNLDERANSQLQGWGMRNRHDRSLLALEQGTSAIEHLFIMLKALGSISINAKKKCKIKFASFDSDMIMQGNSLIL